MEDEHSNTLRILIATDCHLGYMEKDEIRRNDSFYAFDEICSIAEEQQVDFLLLGGDLFHENKPSRTALVRVLEILRRYCLNDRPVRFQVVSDQAVNFPNRFGRVNYEDPHFNVGLPVFTIHGNHDDPAGVDNLSALDILSACNLVNYFGKMVLEGSGVGQITLHPILIQKGFTKAALYGLGNIRDERLNRMFQTAHAVRWIRPENRDDCSVSEWFNILVLHQNRVKMNPKNAINEQFLPRYLDFVIWGHEHECLIDPEEVSGMGFHITQPGSSIATSLIEGEAKPKHVLLLEVKGNQYRPTKIPLKSVRPFEFADVSLKDIPDLNSNDPDSVIDHLSKLVHELIARANIAAVSRPELKLPLIRVRVDYTGFTTINPQRFGQKFVGKVANPHDILTFTKAARKRQSTNVKEENELLRPEELNQQNIEALVAESNLKMEILPVNDLDLALHEFVNKDDRQAFYNCVQNNLEETRTKLIQEADALTIAEEKDLIEKVSQCMQEREKSGGSRILARPSSVVAEVSEDLPIHNINRGSKLAFSDDDDDLLGSIGTSKEKSKSKLASGSSSKGAAGRGRGRSSRGGMKQTTLDMSLGARRSQREASRVATTSVRSAIDNENNSFSSSDNAVEEEDLDEAESEPESLPMPRGRGQKRQSSAGQGRGRGSREPAGKRGRKSALPASTTRTAFSDANHDDDDNDEDDDSGKRGASSGLRSQAPRSWGSLRR